MQSEFLRTLKVDYLDNLRSNVFDEHRERINDENRMSVVILLTFSFLILAVNLVVMPLMGRSPIPQLAGVGIYVVISLIAFVLIRRGRSNYTLLVYLLELPLLLISLFSGTVFDPDYPTFTFLFFLLVLPSIIIDKPARLLCFIWAFGIVFGVMDVAFKPAAMIDRDLLHALNACLISSALCLCLLSARIKNIAFAEQFKEQTLRDPLTGLYNRTGAQLYVDASEPGALLFIDIDNFKRVNDGFGHEEGDRVLRSVAEVLRHNFRGEDVVIRMGGDEFAVFARGRWSDSDLEGRLRQTLEGLDRIEATGEAGSLAISASIGCIVQTGGCESFDEMVRLADREMYRVKDRGKDDFHFERID